MRIVSATVAFAVIGIASVVNAHYVHNENHKERSNPTQRDHPAPQSRQHAREHHPDSKTTTVKSGADESRGKAGKQEHTRTQTGTKTVQRGNDAHTREESDDGPSLIVNGNDAEVMEYPYYVDMNGCGASLIAPGVVLSAAHCAPSGFSFVGKSVIVGGYDRQQITNGALSVEVTATLLHPSYDDWTLQNDFMLLRLASPVTTSGSVKLSLNTQNTVPSTNQPLTVIGNGYTQENGVQSDVLLEANVPAVDTETCNVPYEGAVVDEVMFCAGGEGKDSCQGDSGGPIVVVHGNSHTQVGVVSWGYGCNRPGIPGVYARVSSVMSWIAHVTCTCWGVNDADICSHLDSSQNFSCEDTGGSSGGGAGYGGSGPSGCEIIPEWTDEYGDGCGWYEASDSFGCPAYGMISGVGDKTAWEACCHCEGGESDSSKGDFEGCALIPGWVDQYGMSCGWYEANEVPGCPLEGGVVGTFGATANQACCYCAATIPEIPGGITIPSKIPGEGTIPQVTISSGNRWEVSVSIGLVSLFLSWMHK